MEINFKSDITGLVYGRLTLTGNTYFKNVGRQNKIQVEAVCHCGNKRFFDSSLLKTGQTKSCGCLKRETNIAQSTKHGLSSHPLYRVWIRLKEKCNKVGSTAYIATGAKGVKLCDEWNDSYVAFYNWAIDKWEDGLQLDKDKIYSQKHGTKIGYLYSPEYCCFLTQTENKRYTSRSNFIEFNGERKTLSDWARSLGANRSVLSNRIGAYGWSIEKALTTPIANKSKNIKKRLPS